MEGTPWRSSKSAAVGVGAGPGARVRGGGSSTQRRVVVCYLRALMPPAREDRPTTSTLTSCLAAGARVRSGRSARASAASPGATGGCQLECPRTNSMTRDCCARSSLGRRPHRDAATERGRCAVARLTTDGPHRRQTNSVQLCGHFCRHSALKVLKRLTPDIGCEPRPHGWTLQREERRDHRMSTRDQSAIAAERGPEFPPKSLGRADALPPKRRAPQLDLRRDGGGWGFRSPIRVCRSRWAPAPGSIAGRVCPGSG